MYHVTRATSIHPPIGNIRLRSCIPPAMFSSAGTRTKATIAAERPEAEGSVAQVPKPRKITIMTNTRKAVYVHYRNYYAQWWWYMSTARWYYFVFLFTYGLAHVAFRYRLGKKKSAEVVMIGENLLDDQTKALLVEIEKLRERDPIRLENEANDFHELFWKHRAYAMTDDIKRRREREAREEAAMVGSGTDMSEWMDAKTKDKKEKEISRRTRDYILGFHQHLKVKKLL
ncbi:hypothetical protein XU18_3587 [Perkinsela sp. CCAP 1560/4]|nr:hypothetical protein XU18_3587 [Perkinsela sp. CCAP 1560/4]|eukprot:KNH05416.1 hypothetical protein XU18_3587 [Perkinsela sp. CCAP 1560/4]